MDRHKKELIVTRLMEDREAAVQEVEIAKNKTKSEAAKHGALNGSRVQIYINEDIKHGLAAYLDRSAKFITHVAGPSHNLYANELREAASALKQDVLGKLDHESKMEMAFPGSAERATFRRILELDLDKIIKRKLEDFELAFVEGNKMASPPTNSVTHNTVNIINSNISDTVLTITQSGKDDTLKMIAQKIDQMLKLDEIKNLPEPEHVEVLDHSEVVINELDKTVPDTGKVLRGLKRLGTFLTNTGTEIAAKVIAETTVSWARAHGISL